MGKKGKAVTCHMCLFDLFHQFNILRMPSNRHMTIERNPDRLQSAYELQSACYIILSVNSMVNGVGSTND